MQYVNSEVRDVLGLHGGKLGKYLPWIFSSWIVPSSSAWSLLIPIPTNGETGIQNQVKQQKFTSGSQRLARRESIFARCKRENVRHPERKSKKVSTASRMMCSPIRDVLSCLRDVPEFSNISKAQECDQYKCF